MELVIYIRDGRLDPEPYSKKIHATWTEAYAEAD